MSRTTVTVTVTVTAFTVHGPRLTAVGAAVGELRLRIANQLASIAAIPSSASGATKSIVTAGRGPLAVGP
jgi:hypothetical protein